MQNVDILWLIPALPFLGSLVCGLLHFAVLRARRAGGEAPALVRLAGLIGSGTVGVAFVLAVVMAVKLGGLAAYRAEGGVSSRGGPIHVQFTWVAYRGSIFRITGFAQGRRYEGCRRDASRMNRVTSANASSIESDSNATSCSPAMLWKLGHPLCLTTSVW